MGREQPRTLGVCPEEGEGNMAVKKKAVKLRRRNAARGSSAGPGMETTLAAVLGGGGGALLGGLLVRWGVTPEMSALAMTAGGGVAAYTMSGTMRTAASGLAAAGAGQDRKSTRLNSSHLVISYAVFC